MWLGITTQNQCPVWHPGLWGLPLSSCSTLPAVGPAGTRGSTHVPGHAPQVLEKNSGNTKALYRRAQAHMAAGDYVEAEVDIKAALQVPSGVKCMYAVVHG